MLGIRRAVRIALLAPICLALHSASVGAQDVGGSVTGRVIQVFVDPSDVVFALDTPGPCKSTLYHIERSNLNFQEFYSLVLAAQLSGKTVTVQVTECKPEAPGEAPRDRNVASQGRINLS